MTPLRLLRKPDRHFARHQPAAMQQVRERLAANAERLRLGVAAEENSAPSFSSSPSCGLCWFNGSLPIYTGGSLRNPDASIGLVKGWQGLDGLAGFLLGQAELVELLQIEPEFRAGAEEVG